jgi:cell migration-inducing and hyaluronan-binding protein
VKKPPSFPHYGQVYAYPSASQRHGTGPDQAGADTRAPVGLLTRSIRIVSGGDTLGQDFPAEPTDGNPGYYFGGHMVIRQGFQAVQIRGVEFYQMGQGGRIMHYPVHFHMVRSTPQPSGQGAPVTFIEDSSIWDSMTRWVVLHGTGGVTVARNVGYKSIGHGFYLEDATETKNQFYSNLGVLARAAVINPQNLRQVPGILAGPYPDPTKFGQEEVPFHTDVDHPTLFWITNTWNDFQYNYADGAGTCGACYWFVPAANSTMSRYEYWTSYAGEQQYNPTPNEPNSQLSRVAMTPIKSFEGNQCSTAMNSLNTIGDTAPCFGVVAQVNQQLPRMLPVDNPLAPPKEKDPDFDYYPAVERGGGHFPTECPAGDTDCSTQPRCDSGHLGVCDATVINHYTTSFNFPEYNFAAVWLRPLWYLFSNSAVTDVQNGGLTFVTGGGYTLSDAIQGHWAIARNDAFVGHTQPAATQNGGGGNPWADESGPFNPGSKARDESFVCATQPSGAPAGNFCLNTKAGMIMLLSNFGNNQRFFNIYDGPAFEENNAYLDINPVTITGCSPGGVCSGSPWMYGQVTGVPKDKNGRCYLPNAAVGWKQPNGFYYPPAFHSDNLFFNNVDIRHFVIEPLFTPNTYTTDTTKLDGRYCTYNSAQFQGYTDVDRQTELSDDDGSLTGLVDTISVNKDPFFNNPVEDTECASDTKTNMPPECDPSSETCATAKTSPYAFVTTVVYPDCGPDCPKLPDPKSPDYMHWWTRDCATPSCFGVPLYREFLRNGEQGTKPYIRMAGQSISQRSTLTVNNGTYFMDTTPSDVTQRKWTNNNASDFRGNEFLGGHWYYVFLLYAQPGDAEGNFLPQTTKQTYQIWVGPNFDKTKDVKSIQIPVGTTPFSPSSSNPNPIPTENFSTSYSGDILTVTLDTNFDQFRTNYTAAAQAKCQPQNLCSWNSGSSSCGCVLNQNDPLYGQCNAVCTKWTAKDIDCPKGGCYGFEFYLDPNFKPLDQAQVPAPVCLKQSDAGWDINFVPATKPLAGSCFYNSLPGSQFCTGQ